MQKECIGDSQLEEAERARVVFEFNAVLHLWRKFLEYEGNTYFEQTKKTRIENLKDFTEKEIQKLYDLNQPKALKAKYRKKSEELRAVWNWKAMMKWFPNLNK